MNTFSAFRRLCAAASPRWLPAALFVLVLLAQTLGVQFAERTPYHRNTRCLDGRNFFFPMARSLWAEGMPRDIWGGFCTHQPPLFPAVLAPSLALGEKLGLGEKRVAQILNTSLASLAALGVFMVVRGLLAWPIALAVALAFGFYPPLIWLCRDAYNEPLYTALLVWALLFVFRGMQQERRAALALGASLLALATLTRAIGLPVPFLVAAMAWWPWRKGLRRFLALWAPALAIYLAMVSAWSVVVSMKVGRVSPVTTSLNWSHVGGMIRVPGQSWTSRQAEQFVKEHYTMAWPDIARFHLGALRSHPGDYARTVLFKMVLPWFATDSRQGQMAMLALNAPILLLAIGGLIALKRSRQPVPFQIRSLLLLVVYFWAMTVFVFSVLRYMVPVMWIVLLLAGVLVGHLTNCAEDASSAPAGPAPS